MSKQVINWKNRSVFSTSTRYTSLVNGQLWSATEAEVAHPWSCAGRFSNLEVTITAEPGVGNSRTFVVRINGVDSSLTVTISGTNLTARLIGVSVSVSQWDVVSLKATSTGTPAATSNIGVSFDFDGTTAGQQCYGLGSTQPLAATRTNRLFFPCEASNWSATSGSDIASIDGNVNAYRVTLENAILAGTWTFVIYKNGTVQDGAGGTVDTRLTFTVGDPVTKTATFTLPVAAGDVFLFEGQETVSATAINGVSFGVLFTATNPGEFMFGASATGNFTSTETLFARISGGNPGSVLNTEPGMTVKVGITPYFLSRLRVILSGTATSYLFSLRKNAVSTNLAVNISGAASGSDLTNKQFCKTGDLLAMECDPTGSPTTRIAGWSFAATAKPNNPAKDKGKGGSGGGLNIISPGTNCINIGNPGVSIGSAT